MMHGRYAETFLKVAQFSIQKLFNDIKVYSFCLVLFYG